MERSPVSYIFSPEDRSLPIATVINPERVGILAVGPRMLVKGKLDPELRTIEVSDYRLASSFASDDNDSNFSTPVKEALKASRSIVSRIDDAAKPGAQSVTSRSLDRASEFGEKTLDDMAAFAAAYRSAVDDGDAAMVSKIVSRWREVRQTIGAALPDGTQYKALYGAADFYAAWRYDRIFAQSAAVLAIGEPGQSSPRCSGVLIAEDLVLTAAHCFAAPPQMEPGDLEVWFGFAEKPEPDFSRAAPIRRRIKSQAVAPAPDKWPLLMKRQYNHSLYDYAIVRFVAPDGEPLLPEVEIIPGRKIKPSPQCLRRIPPQRADALYVLGFPNGNPATVHDNSRVELPYRVLDGDDFSMLRLDVDADFRESDDHDDVLREFDASYVLDDTGGLRWWYLFDIRDGGQPRMGIVADTFRGNSGGPVYDHQHEQCVVGILNRGMDDSGVGLDADWKVHERVLPIRAILEDLERDQTTQALITDNILRIK
ncbi:hypothetical protein JOH50_006681 [Rhizobium leguminosarum]|uniref:trypsin-like serine peptidase n=1 Tax=Rhizobium leguminosarum TaxID=384 RepID=UPI001AE9326B|nr:trypsin-like peptidase domain-containing protein [Rhizobium leguminosarum]MBP2490885.1 hypothetical protein [Rhizobium leguminosarum]